MEIIINTQFDIGNNVTVVDNGFSYTSNSQWAKKHGLKNFADGEILENGVEGVVVAIGLHGNTNNIMCGIEVDSRTFIVDEFGLE